MDVLVLDPVILIYEVEFGDQSAQFIPLGSGSEVTLSDRGAGKIGHLRGFQGLQ